MNQSDSLHPRSGPDGFYSAVPGLQRWRARIDAAREPALLSRLLQKFQCQSAVLHALVYHEGEATSGAKVEFIFTVESSRAELLVKQWMTLIPVTAVHLTSWEES